MVSSTTEIDKIYDIIYRSAIYSALSYCTKRDSIFLGKLNSACTSKLCYESDGDVFVEYVFKSKVSAVVFRDENRHEIILALKGTTSNEEWLMDFKILPMPYHPLSNRIKGWKKFWKYNKDCKGCTVHKGFYDGAKVIHDAVFDKVNNLLDEYPTYNFLITGHSLGGALAPMIANEYDSDKRRINVITFGAPKFGNKQLAEWLNEIWNTNDHCNNIKEITKSNSYIRVSHKGDLVPMLPIRQMGYKHSGIDVYFNTDREPMLQENMELKNSLAELSSFDNNTINTASEKDFHKAKDNHKFYILRMNQCSPKMN